MYVEYIDKSFYEYYRFDYLYLERDFELEKNFCLCTILTQKNHTKENCIR